MRKSDVLTKFLNLKVRLQVSFWGAPYHANIIEFSNFIKSLKIRILGAELRGFSIILIFENNYDVVKSKGPCFLLNKDINFNKNETESKLENPTHTLER